MGFSIDPNSHPHIRLISACLLSSTTSAVVTHPIDTIKVRLQTSVGSASSAASLFAHLRHPTALYRGVASSVVRNGVFVTTKMYTYSALKRHVREDTFGAKFGAGMFAGLIGAVVGTPFDMATVRIQNDPRKYAGMREALWSAYRERGGVVGLWTGLYYTSTRAMVVTACQFGVFDQMRQELEKRGCGESGRFVGGAIASAVVTAVVSNPIDVCKSRIMSSGDREASSVLRIVAAEGLGALWKGCAASTARQIPLNLTRFGLLDLFKRLLDVRE